MRRAMVLAVLVLAGCSAPRAAGPITTTAPTTHKVTYKVTGSTDQASITYQTANGETAQQADIDVPMTPKGGGSGLTQTFRDGAFVYISAQNSNDSGEVTCVIEVDGEVVETNTSRGGYVIATCSGTV